MTKRHFREWYILNIYFYKVHYTLLGLGLLASPQYFLTKSLAKYIERLLKFIFHETYTS